MWFFMILCYLMSLLTFFLLLLNGLQGYVHFKIFQANHATLAILTIILYLFTKTLIIFYFVGIGVSIKEFMIDNKKSGDYHKRIIGVKRRIYPPLLLNMLLVMVLFISGGAVDTKHIAGWIHGLLFYISVIHFAKTAVIEHQSFKESANIVIEMAKQA
ncbi:MAG TPA: hypothetical protein VJA17_03365 [Candidatus Omnitrophota bacterium]|nr:hypothetical protein [Candidatus Omnitrophota bacterium]